MLTTIYTKLESYFDEMVVHRRHLHQYPELSFKETETATYISSFYDSLQIPYRKNVGGNGIVATIKGDLEGPTIALRADFDALPIEEENDVPYRSKNKGAMHACGHDGHTATLMVLAKVLWEERHTIPGTIVFLHQHAEEYAPGGAKSMIEDGCLEGVDAVFGTHLWASEPTGKIQYRTGPIMAAADRFEITIQGSGGHGAQPHKTRDSILIGTQVVNTLQQIVSRRINPLDPAVVSVGSFIADNAFNVIADKAKIIGTVRTFSEDVRTQIEKEIENVVKGLSVIHDSSYDYTFDRGYPAVVNEASSTELFVNVVKEHMPEVLLEEAEMQMGGEDFAYYLQHVPGTFFFTGAKPNGVEFPFPHHHPRFDFDEEAMLIAAKGLVTVALAYKKKQEKLTVRV